MSSIKALLFDMGGVVVTVHFDKLFQAWADSSSLTATEIKDLFEFDEVYEQHERGLVDASEFFAHQRKKLQLTGTDEQLAEGWNTVIGAEITQSMDAIDTVNDRIPTFGFTNTNRTHQIYWEAHFPRLGSLFQKLYASSEIGLRKPDAEAFNHILDEVGIQPDELLFFDDSIENIEGAKKLGIQTVLVTDTASVVNALQKL